MNKAVKKKILDQFGKMLMERVRDYTLEQLKKVLYRIPPIGRAELRQSIQKAHFTSGQLDVAWRVVIDAVDQTLNNFLWAMEEEGTMDHFHLSATDKAGGPAALDRISDGLSGELYTDEGWIARFSRFPTKLKF